MTSLGGLKGIKQIKGFDADGNPIEPTFESGYLYFVRTSIDSGEEGYIALNGKKYGKLSEIDGLDCGEY